MKHRLSFGYFTLLTENIVEVIIVEVIIDEGIELSLEMIEECDVFFKAHIFGNFGMLNNRVNQYSYSDEAQLCIGFYEGLKAIAFVYYSDNSQVIVEKITLSRVYEQWNTCIFSGLDLEWQQAFQWLQGELLMTNEQAANIG
jgi:hypothetical protein